MAKQTTFATKPPTSSGITNMSKNSSTVNTADRCGPPQQLRDEQSAVTAAKSLARPANPQDSIPVIHPENEQALLSSEDPSGRTSAEPQQKIFFSDLSSDSTESAPAAPKPMKKPRSKKTRNLKKLAAIPVSVELGTNDNQLTGDVKLDLALAPTASEAVSQWANNLMRAISSELSPQDAALIRCQIEELQHDASAPVKPASDPLEPILVRDEATLRALAIKVATADVVTIDLETSGLDHRQGEIVGLGLAVNHDTYYIPVNHRFKENDGLRPDQLPLNDILAALELQNKPLIAHNAKFELKWLRQHGNIECNFVWDTMLVAHLLRSDLPADLEKLAVRELDVPEWGLSSKEMKTMQHQPIPVVARYCVKDCWYTHLLYRKQQPCLN
jgi:hypothetical protein